MINLNILPPHKKLALARERTLFITRKIIIYTIIVLFFSLTFLWGNNLLIEERVADIEQQIEASQQITKSGTSTTLDQKISQYNQRAIEVYKLFKATEKWSEVVSQFTKNVPDGIQFTYWSLQKAGRAVELSGYARTRDDLVLFKDNLQSNPIYTNIEIPISSFLKKTDLDFRIDLSLTNTES
ncbi:MAG: PilN domain-containing protein [Patescibacteria group bacterium]